MQFSKENESRKLLHRSKLSPSILQSLNVTSRKLLSPRSALLSSQVSKIHSENVTFENLVPEKSQLLKMQFSYSPSGKLFEKSIEINSLSWEKVSAIKLAAFTFAVLAVFRFSHKISDTSPQVYLKSCRTKV